MHTVGFHRIYLFLSTINMYKPILTLTHSNWLLNSGIAAIFMDIVRKTVLIKRYTEERLIQNHQTILPHTVYNLIHTSSSRHALWHTNRHLFTQHVSHAQQHIFSGNSATSLHYYLCSLCPALNEIDPKLMLSLNRMTRVCGK